MRIDGPQITGSFNLNGGTVGDLQVFVTTSSLNNLTASVATTGSNTFVGTQTLSGSIIPAVNNTYDLGSPTNQFRHVYISSGSLYVNGTKVLGASGQELQITTDAGQSFKILETGADTITLQSFDGNVTLTSTGGGDIVIDPNTGVIGLKGTVTVYTGNKITSSDGNSIQFGNGIAVTGSIVSTVTPLISGSAQISGLGFATTGSNTFNGNLTVTGYIDTQELRTTYISSSILYRSGSTKFGDDLLDTHAFTGSLLVSGTISVPGSGLVSGSSQLPSGTVSGSAQIDVMSTTNIARLATTGSNTFNGNIIITGNTTVGGYYTFSSWTTGTINKIRGYSGNDDKSIQWNYDNSPAGTVIRDNNSILLSVNSGSTLSATSTGVSISGSLTTTGDINVNSNGVIINRTSSGEPYFFFKKDGVNRGSIYGINGGGLRMFDQSDNQVFTMTGSMIGISETAPTKKLTINIGSNVSDGLLVTGTNRQETRFKSSGEHSNVFIDSGHSNIYLPTLGFQRSSTAYGEIKLQRASNSDSVGSFTESEMVMGSVTTVPISIKTNDVRRIQVASGGNVTVYNPTTINSVGAYSNGTPALNIESNSWAIVDANVKRQLQRPIGYVGDYEQHVILLHPIYNGTLIEFNKCAGTIYSTRGWTYAGLINDTYHVDTATGYASIIGTLTSNYTQGRLYTCTYNGVKYMALLPQYRTSATSYMFDGYIANNTGGETLKLISYRNSNTGTVLNSEINNSLTQYTENDNFVNGLLYPRQGIRFNSGATTLNYYEEGSFTPSNIGSNFNSVTVVWGRYVRIGNQVTINCRWTVDATAGKRYLVFNLPFAFYDNTNVSYTGAVSNYNSGVSSYSSNVGTSVRNSSSSTTQQYVEAVYTSNDGANTLLFNMTYFTF